MTTWQSLKEHPKTGARMDCVIENDRLFISNHPTGIVYADKKTEENGDYKRLAFLSYTTLELEVDENCPKGLKERIERHAARIQSMKGQQYQVTTCGQAVTLGVEA